MPAEIGPESIEAVHYLCLDTGLFDGGSGARTEPTPAPNNNCCLAEAPCEDSPFARNALSSSLNQTTVPSASNTSTSG